MPKHGGKSSSQKELERKILDTSPEICIWMIAFGCLTTMSEIREDYALSKIEHSVFYPAFNNAFAELIDTANATDRFGLILPVVVEKNFRKRIEVDPLFVIDAKFSSFFWKWYNWWADHIFTLTPLVKQQLLQQRDDEPSKLIDYRPPGDWMEYRRTIPKVLNFSVPPGVAKAE